jgi:hypothetical protein
MSNIEERVSEIHSLQEVYDQARQVARSAELIADDAKSASKAARTAVTDAIADLVRTMVGQGDPDYLFADVYWLLSKERNELKEKTEQPAA